jgi:23S rRNA (guanosine2251-2'-O)-methyltransferase
MKFTIFLENIRSLHNVGSILRTADGAGMDRVVMGGYTGAPPDRRIEKVSLGAEDFLMWEKVENCLDFLEKFKASGGKIIALEQTSKSLDLFGENPINISSQGEKFQDFSEVCLVLGNEVEGVSAEILALADIHWEIPMYGDKGSLNVSVAAGIAMYQLREIFC